MMPGIGPAPAAQRRRRNRPARGDWVDLPALDVPILGDMPEHPDGKSWGGRTQALWEAWRRDPATAMWSPADYAYALDTLVLHNVMSARSANEVRLRMDGLGLTPKGKRALRWRMLEAEVHDIAPPRRPADRRRRLSQAPHRRNP
jgi:hypothetical protein